MDCTNASGWVNFPLSLLLCISKQTSFHNVTEGAEHSPYFSLLELPIWASQPDTEYLSIDVKAKELLVLHNNSH